VTTVVLADPMRMWRRALTEVLADCPATVIAEADDAPEAINKVVSLRPDVAIIEPGISDKRGIDVMHEARRQDSPTRFVFLAHQIETRPLYQAFISGADGYLSKTADAPQFCEAIRTVTAGLPAISNDLTRLIQMEIQKAAQDIPVLTTREQDVLTLMAEDLTGAEIAVRLFVAPATVRTHIRAITKKFGVSHRGGAVAAAMRMGLLD
jgi:two-component system nitrate/nitrite response regulator NarL